MGAGGIACYPGLGVGGNRYTGRMGDKWDPSQLSSQPPSLMGIPSSNRRKDGKMSSSFPRSWKSGFCHRGYYFFNITQAEKPNSKRWSNLCPSHREEAPDLRSTLMSASSFHSSWFLITAAAPSEKWEESEPHPCIQPGVGLHTCLLMTARAMVGLGWRD